MPDISLGYTPNTDMLPFHASPAKYRLLLGGAGAGKTSAMCMEDIIQALECPGSTGVIFRRTYPALRDSTQRQYLTMIPRELAAAGDFTKSEGRECFTFPNSSRTLFRCLDDFLKLGSMEFDRVGLDEAREIAEPEFREVAFRRLRGQVGPRRLTACTNPPDDLHWLYKFFVREPAEDETITDRAVFACSTYGNRAHLPAGYIRGLEKGTAQEQRQYLHGQWGITADGPAWFPEFTEAQHVADLQPMRRVEVLRGWDFGFLYPACVFVQVDATGQVSILHEVVGENEDLVHFARRVVQQTDRYFEGCPVRDYCDIAGTQANDRGPTAVGILRKQFGIAPHYRKQGINQGLEAVRTLLAALGPNGIPRLRLHTTCRIGRRAFAGAFYADPKSGEPCKARPYRDWMDALRYVVTPQLGIGREPEGSGRRESVLPKGWRVAV